MPTLQILYFKKELDCTHLDLVVVDFAAVFVDDEQTITTLVHGHSGRLGDPIPTGQQLLYSVTVTGDRVNLE